MDDQGNNNSTTIIKTTNTRVFDLLPWSSTTGMWTFGFPMRLWHAQPEQHQQQQ